MSKLRHPDQPSTPPQSTDSQPTIRPEPTAEDIAGTVFRLTMILTVLFLAATYFTVTYT